MTRRIQILTTLLLTVVLGCGKNSPPVTLEFRLAEKEPGAGLTEKVFSGWGQKDTFYLHSEILMTREDVIDASVTTSDENPAVTLRFSESGAKKFADITGSNIGRHLGMVVDGILLSAPVIRDTIAGGRAVITGDLSDREAQRIVEGLLRR